MRLYPAAFGLLMAIAPATTAAAQSTSAPAPASDRMTLRVPTLSVGAEVGQLLQTETNAFVRPLVMPSVQVALGRRAVLQVEWSRWADGGAAIRASRISDALGGPLPIRGNDLVGVARLTVTTVGGNLMYRVGSSRAAGFVGGGVNAQWLGHELFGKAQVGCVPSLPSSLCTSRDPNPTIIRTTRFRPQMIAGGEVAIAGPLRAVGTVRVQVGDRDPAAAFTGGLRAAVRTRREPLVPLADPQRAVGRETRVVGLDGTADVGRLVALTPTAVVFNPGNADISRPLTEVRRIERVSRNVRKGALIGLVTGAVLSFAIGCDTRGDDCSNRLAMVPITLPLLGGIGVGAGAGIGAMVNAAQRERNLVFAR